MGCSKKTHFECVFPFLYMYPEIKEKHVLTGWGADGYIGVSRKAQMRYSKPQKLWNYHEWCMRANAKFVTWNQFRDVYFKPENCAGHLQHEKVGSCDSQNNSSFQEETSHLFDCKTLVNCLPMAGNPEILLF